MSIYQHMYLLWWSNHIAPAHVSKVAKNFACCVWKHNKCAQVFHIMTIWDIRKSNTLTHNHNYLMGTITFMVHHITPTSPRNTYTTISKAFWFFLLLYSLHIFFLNISCMGIEERREIPSYVNQNIIILLCRSTQMLYMIGGL